MSDLVPLLGTLSIILTFAAVFRISSILIGKAPVLAALVSLCMTVIFLITFTHLILILGVIVLSAPILLSHHYRNKFPFIKERISKLKNRLSRVKNRNVVECESCGSNNDRTNKHCHQCGDPLD